MGVLDGKRFQLTEQHILLLKNMWVEWQDDETGAPAIDPKRPYGDSEVARDIAEILGIEVDSGEEIPKELEKEFLALHRQTQTALQIVLATGEFRPGNYVTSDGYHIDWKLVPEEVAVVEPSTRRVATVREELEDYGFSVEAVERGGFVDVVLEAPPGGLDPDEAEALASWLEAVAVEVSQRRSALTRGGLAHG